MYSHLSVYLCLDLNKVEDNARVTLWDVSRGTQ